MSSPFPNRDFLNGSWETLQTLARKKKNGGGCEEFPKQLPNLNALDLDKIKDAICAYRGWGLCSVDAVTVTADGRILFIEFKVTKADERAWLRKKGFDSLFLFWVAAGQTLTMEEIRKRAVFWYVTPTAPAASDAEMLSQARQVSGWRSVQRSLPDQVEYLSIHGLYSDCRHYSAEAFSSEIQKANIAQSSEEVCAYIASEPCASVSLRAIPSVKQTDDYEAALLPIATLRMENPFDTVSHKEKTYEVLRVATKYDDASKTASYQHDWAQQYAAMALSARCFDTFMMWCLAYHPGERLAKLGKILNGLVSYSGEMPTSIRDTPGFIHRFWEIFHTPYSLGRPLAPFVEQNLYAQLEGEVKGEEE